MDGSCFLSVLEKLKALFWSELPLRASAILGFKLEPFGFGWGGSEIIIFSRAFPMSMKQRLGFPLASLPWFCFCFERSSSNVKFCKKLSSFGLVLIDEPMRFLLETTKTQKELRNNKNASTDCLGVEPSDRPMVFLVEAEFDEDEEVWLGLALPGMLKKGEKQKRFLLVVLALCAFSDDSCWKGEPDFVLVSYLAPLKCFPAWSWLKTRKGASWV